MANIPRGKPATNETQPLQTEFAWIDGSPEGIEFGPAGSFRIDRLEGMWWRKTTPAEFNTGWEMFASGGGALIGIGPPTGVAPDGTQYTDRVTGFEYYYDAIVGWIKRPGGAGGGTTSDVTQPPPDPSQPWVGLPGDGSLWIWNVPAQAWRNAIAAPPP